MGASIDISVRSNIKEFQKSLDNFAYKQLPFATARALTALAKRVQTSETQALSTVLKKKPTPFTQRAFGVIPARKTTQTAVVFAKDIQAKYLTPSEFGGKQLVHRVALLNPKDIRLNAYGNIAKGQLARLKGRSDVFIGTIQGSRGAVAGVWQRLPPQPHAAAHKGRLKLLIRWGEGVEVSKHLGYHDRARLIINANFNRDMADAMNKALETAKVK
ncbi:MAG: hypothetical protein KGI37_07680 [Alphaproteobacteria bacterium]|nr:hypothetical protein [Alphaproteobacteria bacterium]